MSPGRFRTCRKLDRTKKGDYFIPMTGSESRERIYASRSRDVRYTRSSSETAGRGARFRTFRTWKVDCHEESIGRLDLHFLNPRTARHGGEERGV